MENTRSKLRPMTDKEKLFVIENHHLINRFLKLTKKDAAEYYDIVVFGFILSAEIYLNDSDLQERYSFENVSYMYMKRELFSYFRSESADRRQSEYGKDVSYDADYCDSWVEIFSSVDGIADLEYQQNLEAIQKEMTEEQRTIFSGKMDGYTLKEIADANGIAPKRVYRQFAKIKDIVADVMEIGKAI